VSPISEVAAAERRGSSLVDFLRFWPARCGDGLTCIGTSATSPRRRRRIAGRCRNASPSPRCRPRRSSRSTTRCWRSAVPHLRLGVQLAPLQRRQSGEFVHLRFHERRSRCDDLGALREPRVSPGSNARLRLAYDGLQIAGSDLVELRQCLTTRGMHGLDHRVRNRVANISATPT